MTPTFRWPTDSRRVSSGFTDRRSYGQHNAIDIVAPYGAPVRAVADAAVAFAGVAGGCGNAVFLNHAAGWRSHYCHLSTLRVTVGQVIFVGDSIGAVGSSGVSTGPHLHLNLFSPTQPLIGLSAYVDWVGKWAVDPLEYLIEEDDMTPAQVRQIVQEELARANVPPPPAYTQDHFPQPEFGSTFPSWPYFKHVHYLYRLIRRRELRG